MSEPEQNPTSRLAQAGPEAIQRLSQELLHSPLLGGALTRALAVKARADAVSAGVLAQLGLPTADEVNAIRTRLRGVASRTERLDQKLDDVLERLTRIESALQPAAASAAGSEPPVGDAPPALPAAAEEPPALP